MLNESQKDFILKNYKQKSTRKLAKSLNVKRNEIEDFIKEVEGPRLFDNLAKYKRPILIILILTLIFLHLFIRYNTFWLSHVAGDQVQYVGLAMKLENFGFEGYNLRKIDEVYFNEEKSVIAVVPSRDDKGVLLRGLEEAGVLYYDIPFFHKGPAFPIALMASHSIFGTNKYYLLVLKHLGREVYNKKPKEFFWAQFYAAIVPLFFSIILMLLTFCLGKILFSNRIGLYAAFMMAINPISILTSHKLWADDMLSAFVALSVILFILSQKRQRAWISLLAGMSCGMAVLTKQNGGIIFVAIILYSIWIHRTFLKDIRKWPLLIFDKYLVSFGIGLILISAPWFYKIYSLYGNPLYLPPKPDILETDKTGWFRLTRARPHPLKLFTIGIPYISPAFIFVYGTLKKFMSYFLNPFEKSDKESDKFMLLWFWILAFMLFFILLGGGKEHRRMLPAYPAIAILASYALTKFGIFIKRVSKNKLIAEVLIIAMLMLSASWSISIGLSTVMRNGALILRPF